MAQIDVNVKELGLAVGRVMACKHIMNPIFNIDEGYEAACAILREGGLVAVPTETVYGLAADATNADAVAKIFAAKGRPNFNPLISHIGNLEMAKQYGVFNETAEKLAETFWPGPLTLVVPQVEGCGIVPAVTAGLGTIALRHPSGVMAQLAADLGVPLAAPSANTSGTISPTMAQHVADDLGAKVDLVLDGGACVVGLESTILKIEGDTITLLREGGISREQIEQVIGPVKLAQKDSAVQAPGMMLAHYAPSIPVRLNAKCVMEGEALLAFGASKNSSPVATLNLSPTGELVEAAHNLFAMLKQLDKSGAASIAVEPIPKEGLGAAINDRLRRAAHGARHREPANHE